MPPIVPAPDPAGLPAPAWLLQFLSLLTFTLHLLVMNLLLGGALMLAVAAWRRKESRFYDLLAKRLAKALPIVMSLTITLGVAPLLFLQVLYGQAFYTSSALMAWPWMGVIALVMAAYYGLYLTQFRPALLGPLVPVIAWGSALFILATGFLLSNNMTLMLRSEQWGPMYVQSAAGLHLNLADPMLPWRYLHVFTAALAVAGLGLALLAGLYHKEDAEWAGQARHYGAKWFVMATLAQMLVGMLFLFALPERVRMAFLGGSPLDTALLWCGVGVGLVAVGALARCEWLAAAVVAISIALMAVTRHRLRDMLLRPHLDVSTLEVNPQWAMFGIFAVTLVAGLGVCAWMTALFIRASLVPTEAAVRTPAPTEAEV